MGGDLTRRHKADEDRLGYVADYCPVCRTLRAFAFYRLVIPEQDPMTGARGDRLDGYVRHCQTCKATFDAVPDAYTGISPKLKDLPALQAETCRNYYEDYAVQLALDRVPGPQLMGQDRLDRIHDPMLAIGIAAQPMKSHNKMDAISWIALGVAVAFFVAAWPQLVIAGDNFAAWPPLLVGPGVLAVAVAFTRMGIAGRRETLNWATLHLANALAPVRPTDSELEQGLAKLRDRDLWLGSKAKIDKLQAAFEARRLQPSQ
jgi:hypothetical protein